MPPTNSNSLRALKILLHVGFFLSGIATVIIGQLLPLMQEKFALDYKWLGLLFPAQFAGSLIGTFLTSWFGKRSKFLPASILGCFLMSVGALVLNADSYALCLAGFFVNGLGIGLTLPSINMLILELNPERGAASLSVLNFFWGVGAILSQPFVDHFARGTNILTPTVGMSVALFLTGGALALVPKGIERQPEASADEETDFSVPIWSTALAWTIAAFNFIHVGFERAMGLAENLHAAYRRRRGGEPSAADHPVLYFLRRRSRRRAVVFQVFERKPDAFSRAFPDLDRHGDSAFRRKRRGFKRRRFARGFRNLVGFPDEHVAFHKNLRRFRLAPHDAVFHLRNPGRDLHDLVHRLCLKPFRQRSALRNVYSIGKRSDPDRPANRPRQPEKTFGFVISDLFEI